ncbi:MULTISPECIES: NCS2 family permease [Staphylococcus]|uniref:Guanine permease n=1 Tax=Staphylococcus ureilyticus TaxID=94138 RepID=A0AB34AJ29_STAUR|nr:MULTISPECIES: NCS2 family permease [Staphylococcus]AVL77629.1 NCS2 family permease [Staphylococcus cohnii]KKD21230.1 guanine permease [Staphylococcus cohnii subsp. cohnii]MBL0377001.1 NCS2 family permease [Staphylococcus sp. S75]MBL0383976.1 NCS2 family permease [Staphylococcus sp. S59]MBL0400372.1 NCS2 family permease [Staphylococcus sp. S36]PIS62284.1 guanine permease [Corynebacterium striatum]
MKKYFKFEKHKTNYKKEILGGLTTFLSMAYILAVNPQVLSLAGVKGVSENMKMDQGAIFVATALAAFVGSLFMGLIARYPIALAPGMGLNAFFAFTVVLTMGIPWQVGLTGVLFSGVVFAILTMTGLRETIINAIPYQMKMAVSAGIGLFITFVGLQSSGIITNNDSTLVTLGHITDGPVLLTIFGIIITVILYAVRVPGAIFIGMVLTSILGMLTGLIHTPSGIVGKVPSIEPTFGAAFEAFKDPGQLFTVQFLIVILTFLFIDFFDTAGTLVAVATQAGMMKNNKLPRAGRALFSDSLATIVGSIFGTTTTTSYIESTSGVAVGARTGFASVVTGFCFLLAIFFSPLMEVVTSAVTTPALVVVGVLMAANFAEIDWKKFEVAVPAFITIIMMPLSYSIATGIACGFIFYPITMLISKRHKEVHPIMYALMILFILYFVFVHG